MEFERAAEESVEYGSKLFEKLAVDLKKKYGKGFSRSNVVYMRLFFQKFPKSQTLSDQLSWIHFLKPIFLQEPVRLSWIVIFNQNIYKSILFT